ncbi:MAG: hypothetical protein PUK54_00080 [Firmicutes bacterium]|nr:hypothetical protein [Bacillota bacterium]MDY5856659.1 hypothetical protein [Anaerovoracaceae bacterium]
MKKNRRSNKKERRRRLRCMRVMVLVLCLVMTAGSCPAVPAGNRQAAAAEKNASGDTVIIALRTQADFLAFAQKCTSDSWSRGKTFRLEADIDLEGSGFRSVPVFGGVFDGNGHTISGYTFRESASPQGLFRYVQESGVIRDLTLEGSILPEGSREKVGGIAGENEGTIQGCRFAGTVGGDAEIGGIAGVNKLSGIISGCRTCGVVYGKKYVGGIAGRNYGTILRAENQCSVNTTVQTEPKMISSVDISTLTLEELNQEVNVTDIGGIAGWSEGVLQDCLNEGTVGYLHTGYNVGGIVGRQSGYVNQCENRAGVYGRKDVGGIAGQMEPYSTILSISKLSALRRELSTLQTLIDRLLNDVDATSARISGQIKSISISLSEAEDAADSLIRQTENRIDTNLDAASAVSVRVSETMTQMEPVLEQAETMLDELGTASAQLQDAVRQLRAMSPEIRNSLGELDQSLADLSAALAEVSKGSREILEGIDSLKQSLGDEEKVCAAVEKIRSGMLHFSAGLTQVRSSENAVRTAVQHLQSSDAWKEMEESISGQKDPLRSLHALKQLLTSEELKELLDTEKNALPEIISGVKKMREGLTQITEGIADLTQNQDLEQLEAGLNKLESGAKSMEKALSSLSSAATHLRNASFWVKQTEPEISSAMKSIEEAADTLQTALLDGKRAMSEIHRILSDLAARPAITFSGADSTFTETQEALSDSIGTVMNGCSALSDVAAADTKKLTSDLQKVSDQLIRIFNLLLDLAEETGDRNSGGESAEAKTENEKEASLLLETEDVSAADTEERTEGKAAGCRNFGPAEGDINVGGIAGSIAYEVDFDPEDDLLNQNTSLLEKTTRYARAVIRDCENQADITAKKNDAGGIVGRMDFGYVKNCAAARNVTSRSGDYTGGIAGFCGGKIDACSSKTVLSGRDYVGGIAGTCSGTVNDCRAVVRITSSREHSGAVAGLLEENGTASGNLYVDQPDSDGTLTGGIDQISYRGRAEAVSFEELEKAGIPVLLEKYTVRFLADGSELKSVTVPYGTRLEDGQIPHVPEKEGYYGSWDKETLSSVTSDLDLEADYTRYVTVLASGQTREGGSSVLLAEGNFTEESWLQAQPLSASGGSGTGPADAIEMWNVTLMHPDDEGKHQYRYRIPDDCRSDLTILIQEDGRWRKAKTKQEGRCLVFQASGTTLNFAVTEHASGMLRNAVLAVLLCSAAALAGRFFRKRRKRMQKGQEKQ